MCEHKNVDGTSSLLIDFKRFFGIYPRYYNAICKLCGENFKLSEDETKEYCK